MNSLQIEYFLAVAKNLSFTKAAKVLFVSQPAISRQILALEDELGHSLFDRTNKVVSLTEVGDMYSRFFTEYQSELNNVKIRAQLISENRVRGIRIGIVNGWDVSGILPPAIEAFSKEHASISIQVNSYEVNAVEQALLNDKEDIVLTIDPITGLSKSVLRAELARIPRMLIYPKAHPLAVKEDLVPEDFRDETFFVVTGDNGFYAQDLVKGFCKPYGFVPRLQPVSSTDAMLSGINCGLGVAILDAWHRELCNPRFGYLKLNSLHTVNLLWKETWNDPIIKVFSGYLKQAAEK